MLNLFCFSVQRKRRNVADNDVAQIILRLISFVARARDGELLFSVFLLRPRYEVICSFIPIAPSTSRSVLSFFSCISTARLHSFTSIVLNKFASTHETYSK